MHILLVNVTIQMKIGLISKHMLWLTPFLCNHAKGNSVL